MKIVIAIDSSAASQYVVNEAAARPWPKETVFSVITVIDPYRFVHLPSLIEDAKQEGATLVKAAACKLAHAGHSANSEMIVGTPRTGISEYAKQYNADFIMVGSRGQGSLARFLLGSVAQGILHTAPCSVEIVRPSPSGSPASSVSMKILLAVDGSEFSAAAARSVANRPWPTGSQFTILSVEELPMLEYPADGSPLSPVYSPGLLQELLDGARTCAKEAVDRAREILLGAGLKPLESKPAPVGNARVLILDLAKEWEANLIVLGSHGRRGMERLIMGSVSESVALYAHCSVEIIAGGHSPSGSKTTPSDKKLANQ
jgi:nucleotide-binding universal stress UspA family protein